MKRLRKHWKLLSLTTLVLVVLWLGVSLVFVYWWTRREKPQVAAEPAPTLPWAVGIVPLRLTTSDSPSLKLGAWFIPGEADRPVVLLLHGKGQCRSDFLGPAGVVAGTGCGLLMVTLRAHGDSEGDLNDIGYSAQHDVIAAVEWLEANHRGRPVVVFGHSLGAAAATFAAKDLGTRVAGYILDAPYRDLRTALGNRVSWALLPGLVTVAPLILDLDQIAPIKAVKHIPPGVPVLILNGGADRAAPKEQTQAIADCIGAPACRFVIVEGGEHGKLHTAPGTTYRDEIVAFVARF